MEGIEKCKINKCALKKYVLRLEFRYEIEE